MVNNAGIFNTHSGPTEWLIKQDYKDPCDVNLFGLIDVTRIFLPLIKKKKGRIVNTASVVGRVGFPGAGPYVVSKYGVEGFSECLRYDQGDKGFTSVVWRDSPSASGMTRVTKVL